MKLKEIEQVEIFPPTTYFFHFHNSRKISPPQKNPLCSAYNWFWITFYFAINLANVWFTAIYTYYKLPLSSTNTWWELDVVIDYKPSTQATMLFFNLIPTIPPHHSWLLEYSLQLFYSKGDSSTISPWLSGQGCPKISKDPIYKDSFSGRQLEMLWTIVTHFNLCLPNSWTVEVLAHSLYRSSYVIVSSNRISIYILIQ